MARNPKGGNVIRVNPLHGYFRPAHLEHVVREMKRLGPPVLRGYFDAEWNTWHAREGTHRLRAALRLGLTPVFAPVKWGKTKAALERARVACCKHGHTFDRVITLAPCAEMGFSPLGTGLESDDE